MINEQVSPVSYANVPANAQKYLRLCTGFPMGINYRKMQGAQKVIMGKTQEGHAHFCPQSQIRISCILTSEGHRAFKIKPESVSQPGEQSFL